MILCRWCEQPIHSKYVAEFSGPIWLHNFDNSNKCGSGDIHKPWNRNYGRINFNRYGPSTATPLLEDETTWRYIRAAERGLRNLLRNL